MHCTQIFAPVSNRTYAGTVYTTDSFSANVSEPTGLPERVASSHTVELKTEIEQPYLSSLNHFLAGKGN